MSKGKVVVGMSGGVDSSVAAWLLKEQGFEVVGLFMKNWEDDDTDEYCTSREDLVDAVNFSAEYKERVFANFLAEYKAGRTPNPDVLCNAEIKFKAFLDHALALGAERIATGHYAQVREVDGLMQLLKAEDGTKDQSYFLYRLDQRQLAKTLFPLGTLYKREVRDIARRLGLSVHDKKDSTGICFIGERPFREFLMRYLPPQPGDMVTPDDRDVGRHSGLMYYTIGQRQGLGIGGAGEPWYVVAKDVVRNVLVVAQGHDHPALFSDRLSAAEVNWIAGTSPHCHWVYAAKTRYRQPDAPCTLTHIDGDGFDVAFATPQWAVTPGQSVVVYESKVCLGGGIISGSRRGV